MLYLLVNAKLFQIAETLPQEVLEKMHAPPKAADVPIITPDELAKADGILFGIPTRCSTFAIIKLLHKLIFNQNRFGMIPAQMKAFFDSCGQLWMSGAL